MVFPFQAAVSTLNADCLLGLLFTPDGAQTMGPQGWPQLLHFTRRAPPAVVHKRDEQDRPNDGSRLPSGSPSNQGLNWVIWIGLGERLQVGSPHWGPC